jgi:glycolate oxidase
MASEQLIQELMEICGKDSVLHQPLVLYLYEYDAGMERGKPDVVVFPTTTVHIQRLVKYALAKKIPYTVRGAATNLCGGTVAANGGMVIETVRLNSILEVDIENQVVVVEPGLLNIQLQNALAPLGFFYAPDPASQKASTLGGNVAMNAGGPHCLKYGVTVNHVLGMEVVMPDGELVQFGGKIRESVGYDLVGFLNGSEGTLGIITKLFLRILPLPEAVTTLLVDFMSIQNAAQAVSAIIARGVIPATLEYMDNTCIRVVADSLQVDYPVYAAAVLIIEIDGPYWSLQPQVETISSICRQYGAGQIQTAQDEAERTALWAGRRGALGAMTRLRPSVVVFDGTVPRNKLPAALMTIDEISKKHRLQYGTLLHAGDGNIHPIIVYDERDLQESERVHAACDEIMKLCVQLGGTITGEHGIGLEKLKAMRYLFSENEIKVMRQMKNRLDPFNLCNPGKVLPA